MLHEKIEKIMEEIKCERQHEN